MMAGSFAQSIGHRGHREFVAIPDRSRSTQVDDHDLPSFDLDSELHQLRRPERPVSAPPVVGIEGWTREAQGTPPLPVAVPGMTPAPPDPAPRTRFIPHHQGEDEAPGRAAQTARNPTPDAQQAVRPDKRAILR